MRPWCEHCQKSGHTKETCWDIHGKPPDWKPNKGAADGRGKAFQARAPSEGNVTTEKHPFAKEQ